MFLPNSDWIKVGAGLPKPYKSNLYFYANRRDASNTTGATLLYIPK